jgi:hypothetical protein
MPVAAWGGAGAGFSLNVDDWGVWVGAGGDWAMPGVPITNQGIRSNPTTAITEVWDSTKAAWVPVPQPIWSGTQAQFDAIASPNPAVLYVILPTP